MDFREKLVGLIEKASYECDEGTRDLWDMREVADGIADFLIVNGVTVQEWISVKDRLPEGADGKSICENVIAYLNNGEVEAQVCPGWLNGEKWYLLV